MTTSEALWGQVRMAWAMLGGRPVHPDVAPGRPRAAPAPPREEDPPLATEGFAEEALPWLDAVHHFALRLTQGDRDAADDLTQDTFLRAHRFWHSFTRGTNAKSWLFTICRNTFLHERERLRNRREQPAADFDARVEALAAVSALGDSIADPEQEIFGRLIEDEVLQAIDALPDEFREALVLSDLGDLTYEEIAEVIAIPVGTAKSRVFRARRLLQGQIREFRGSGRLRESRFRMKMKIGGISCDDALARLWEFLDGELAPGEEAAVRRHLEICGRCYPRFDFQRAYFAYTRQLRERDRVPAEARRRLFAALLAQEAGDPGEATP